MSNKIVCVVPTIRPESHNAFVKAWTPLFEKYNVTLVTVWDGEDSHITGSGPLAHLAHDAPLRYSHLDTKYGDLFCRRTDACRNIGFVAAAHMNPDYVLTLDDDCWPWPIREPGKAVDPIQAHIDALNRRVPLSWMNTAHDTDLYLRGVPYGVRDEAPVMLSHGVWMGTPDFDGETQLRLEYTKEGMPNFLPYRPPVSNGVPYSLPYYVGPIPCGVLFPLCGMNVMVRREALPYLYYAPQGPDAGVTVPCLKCGGCGGVLGIEGWATFCPDCKGTGKVPALHRFADIFMGVYLKRKFDELGWGCVTGYSTVLHTRASDARKNYEQEKLGREWMEKMTPWMNNEDPPGGYGSEMCSYFRSYEGKRNRYAALIESILGEGKV